jgi:RNA polymerase sigma-70 factor (ECF subfamily)
VARLALDARKAAHRQRETYIGPWRPEPLVQPLGTQPLETAESLSLAFLHLLESLSPAERVAFLLREAFEADYGEIAATLNCSEANCRQIVARARKHIRDGRPRLAVDRDLQEDVLRRFLVACSTGDPVQVTALLSEDVTLYSDGGGKVAAALNPIAGPDRVSRFLTGLARKGGRFDVQLADVNGAPGAILWAEGAPSFVLSLELDEEGRVRTLFFIGNPDKLTTIKLRAEGR